MAKPRACDVCSLRKIKCNGANPCLPCSKAGFDCSFAKKPLKPGPKGPRLTTSNRIKKQLDDIRTNGGTPKKSSSSGPRSTPGLIAGGSKPPPITFSDVCAYLEMFHHKMYPIWPVVDRTYLVNSLGQDLKDPELSALAFAVCAATGAQLRLCSEPNPTTQFEQTSLCDRLAIEAERRRLTYDYREGATVSGVLIPFFLHAYYTKKQRRYSSTLYIREAVTLAQLLGLDREASYAGLPPQEAHSRRKIFWLLFVTERGHAMQYDVAALLRPSIELPHVEDDKDPHLITAFLSLVRLFVVVDGMLAGEGVDDPGRVFTPESLESLQRQLGQKPDFAPFSNEVQKTDVFITQQWMRMLLWQLSMKKVSLTASGPDNPLSLTYPDQIARDALSFLTRVSLDSVIAHGPGMELKIFEIANTLLDVINVVPSLSHPQQQSLSLSSSSSKTTALTSNGPREVFHALSCVLSSISGGKSTSITLLQAKMAESSVPFSSIPRMLQLHIDPHDYRSTSSPPSSGTIEAGNPSNTATGRETDKQNHNNDDDMKITGWIQGQDDHHHQHQVQAISQSPPSSSSSSTATTTTTTGTPLQIQPQPQHYSIHTTVNSNPSPPPPPPPPPHSNQNTLQHPGLPAAPHLFLHHHNPQQSQQIYYTSTPEPIESTSTPTTSSWTPPGSGRERGCGSESWSSMTPAVELGGGSDGWCGGGGGRDDGGSGMEDHHQQPHHHHYQQ